MVKFNTFIGIKFEESDSRTFKTCVGALLVTNSKAHIPLEMGFPLGTKRNEIYTKNMKCTWPTPAFCVGTQRNLYSTDWRRGMALGMTQILALGNAKIYQHVGIFNAKFWRRGHCPTTTPDARYFASQWNIGLTLRPTERITVTNTMGQADKHTLDYGAG